MTAKYYTQFLLTDANYWGGNEFSGIVELNRAVGRELDEADIEELLAKNFDLDAECVKLISWSRVH